MMFVIVHASDDAKIIDFCIDTKYLLIFLNKMHRKEVFLPFLCKFIIIICLWNDYSAPYSSQALIAISSTLIEVNALMKAEARRSLVMRGTLKSMAARRIL